MVMLGTGAGLKNGVMREFEGGATNSFFVWTQRTQKPWAGMPAGRNIQLANADVQAIRDKVPETAVVAPRNQLGGYMGGNNVSRGRKTGAFSIMGDYPEIQRIQSFQDRQGRFLSPIDIEEIRKVAVIGSRVATSSSSLKSIRSANRSSSTASIFKWWAPPMQSGDEADRDAQTIFVPFTTFQRAFNFGDQVGWLAVVSIPQVPASKAEEKVLTLLKSRHRVAPDDERAFGHFNLEGGVRQDRGPLPRYPDPRLARGHRHPGRRSHRGVEHHADHRQGAHEGDWDPRAVGAKPSAIVGQIVFEAMILTALAGYLGMVAGIALIEIVGNVLPEVTAPACSSIRT